ncbi:hypothetical protein ASG11_10355 [Sphingomonas sp. Leaf357]|uniref:hypothetical protein n=1 Tax=Sphingomonas sp. Leaf357 TaxID=1736350 RepID=UPI0006F7EADB|nr:hypothetical protein [Sphingomonas sp. Leaf357]KQS04602.1 hypothetical protein ASG11_10355 [Sphingomonas sp. Leaf357]
MSDGSAHEMGRLVGAILGLVMMVAFPIIIGYFVGDRLAKKRGLVGTVKWPIRVGFGISLILLLSYCAGKNNAARAGEIIVNG